MHVDINLKAMCKRSHLESDSKEVVPELEFMASPVLGSTRTSLNSESAYMVVKGSVLEGESGLTWDCVY